MIPIEYYKLIYHLGLGFIIILLSFIILKRRNVPQDLNNLYCFILFVFCILFIGLRDAHGSYIYFGDTITYTRMYESTSWERSSDFEDRGFGLFLYVCSKFIPVQYFYLLCALLYVGLPLLTFRKWFKNNAWIALAVSVSVMSFFSFGINVLRNGLAAAFFIYGLSKKNKLYCWTWFLISFSFHKSMILPIISYSVAYYKTNISFWLKLWLISIPFSFLFGSGLESFITNNLESLGLSDRRTDNLFSSEFDSIVTRAFRFDFIIYSSIPILLGYYYIIKRKFFDQFYIRILNTYIIANSIWIIMIYAAFTDRIAFLSWFLMPIILIYPILKTSFLSKQNFWIFWIILGNLIFTLLMFFKS